MRTPKRQVVSLRRNGRRPRLVTKRRAPRTGAKPEGAAAAPPAEAQDADTPDDDSSPEPSPPRINPDLRLLSPDHFVEAPSRLSLLGGGRGEGEGGEDGPSGREETIRAAVADWIEGILFGVHAAGPSRAAAAAADRDEDVAAGTTPPRVVTAYRSWFTLNALGHRRSGDEFEACVWLEEMMRFVLQNEVDLRIETSYGIAAPPSGFFPPRAPPRADLSVRLFLFSTSSAYSVPFELVCADPNRLAMLTLLIEGAGRVFSRVESDPVRRYATFGRLKPGLAFRVDPERFVYTFCYAFLMEASMFGRFGAARQVLQFALRRTAGQLAPKPSASAGSCRSGEGTRSDARTAELLRAVANEIPSLGVRDVDDYIRARSRA